MDKISAMQSFVRVAELGSFSAAAQQLGRSKATVSKQIAELEARLGAQLLLRTTRQVRLTEAGQAYQPRARQLLADLDDIESQVERREAALSGSLRVAAPNTFSELYLVAALHAFMTRHSRLDIELVLTDGFVDLLRDDYDLAIRVSLLEDSSLIARRLAASTVVCCAAPGYLIEHGTPATPEQLADHALVVDTNMRNANQWRFVVDGAIRGIRSAGRVQVNSATMVRNLLLNGVGIGLIPEFVVLDALADGSLLRLPLTVDPYDLGAYAVYPQRRYLSQRVRVFVDFLVAWFADGLEQARARDVAEWIAV